jgi:ABC-type sugar transport system ATPase subunit
VIAVYEARNISKRYGSVVALQDVSMRIEMGAVHAMLGANGAGKSTLMKVLAGAERPSEGDLYLDGLAVRFHDTGAALDHGIAWVAQELTVFEQLDVLENLFLTREPCRGHVTSRREMRRRARPFLSMVGLDEELDGPLGLLPLGERQRVEICRALLREPRILILDEPTSALDASETQRLFEVVRGLRDSGVGVILVSHFLEDVFAIADTITVLRDARTIIDAAPREGLTPRMAIDAMLGERPAPTPGPARRAQQATPSDDPAIAGLRLEDVTVDGVLDCVSLKVRPGEIVALAGLEGSGPTALLNVIYGQLRIDAGSVVLPGGRPGPRNIAAAVKAGVAFVPSDRGRAGLFADQSVRDNIGAVRALALSVDRLLLRTRELNDRAVARVAQLQVRPSRVDVPVRALSGGNQQKIVFAKWLEANPTVYLLDDPTRGVDIHTRAQMHQVIRGLADEGATVLIASGDLDELCDVADRAVVFFHGRAVGEIPRAELDAHRLLEAINTGAIEASMPTE